MDLNEFIGHVAEQFEETDVSQINALTKFQELDEYSSLIALSLIAMIDEEYDVTIKGNDLRSAATVEDLFNTVKSKKG